MKQFFVCMALFLLATSTFAQTRVAADKLGKTLEKNKDASAVFVSEIDLRGLTVASDGTVTIPFLAKSKVALVAEWLCRKSAQGLLARGGQFSPSRSERRA